VSIAVSTAPRVRRLAARIRVAPPDLAFAALLALGAVLVVVEMRGFSFSGDEWDFLIMRRGTAAKVLLTPHGPHLSLVPILVYKAMLQLFGMGSYGPYKALAAADLVLLALAVGLIARRRWGPWWGLAPVALLVTLGPGAETLLWPFQVGVVLATVAGLIALIAADYGARATDAIACTALCVSLASGSQGIGALFGVLMVIALAPRRLRRAWVVAVPALLYVLWYAHYGHQASETHLARWASALPYSMQSFSSTLSALAGLGTLQSQSRPFLLDPTYGRPLALALLVLIAVAIWRGWRPPRLFWGAVASLIVLWIAAALSNNDGMRPPTTPRYLPVNAAFLLFAAIAALPRPRIPRGGRVAACAALAIIAATNAGEFSPNRGTYTSAASPSRAVLGALLVARGIVPLTFNPATAPAEELSYRLSFPAGPFFSAVDAFGTNAFTPAQLLRAPPASRELADGVLARAEGIGLTRVTGASPEGTAPPTLASGSARVSGICLLDNGSGPVAVFAPPPGVRIETPASGSVQVALSRFGMGAGPGYGLGQVPPGGASVLRVQPDRAPRVPWRVLLTGGGARVCSI
jgi:hypothetical protein